MFGPVSLCGSLCRDSARFHRDHQHHHFTGAGIGVRDFNTLILFSCIDYTNLMHHVNAIIFPALLLNTAQRYKPCLQHVMCALFGQVVSLSYKFFQRDHKKVLHNKMYDLEK